MKRLADLCTVIIFLDGVLAVVTDGEAGAVEVSLVTSGETHAGFPDPDGHAFLLIMVIYVALDEVGLSSDLLGLPLLKLEATGLLVSLRMQLFVRKDMLIKGLTELLRQFSGTLLHLRVDRILQHSLNRVGF